MRLFPTKWVQRCGWAIIAAMTVVTVSGEIPLIVQCRPIEGAWDPNIKAPKCFTPKALENIQLYQAILMLIFDVLIVALPIPTVWSLHMPVTRRLVVIGLFGLGKSLHFPVSYRENQANKTRTDCLLVWSCSNSVAWFPG